VARRRRAQQARATSKHVSWLAGLLQAGLSHHTAKDATTRPEENANGLQWVLEKFADMQTKIDRLFVLVEQQRAEEAEATKHAAKAETAATPKLPLPSTSVPAPLTSAPTSAPPATPPSARARSSSRSPRTTKHRRSTEENQERKAPEQEREQEGKGQEPTPELVVAKLEKAGLQSPDRWAAGIKVTDLFGTLSSAGLSDKEVLVAIEINRQAKATRAAKAAKAKGAKPTSGG